MCASLTMGKRVSFAIWQIVIHDPAPNPILAPFLFWTIHGTKCLDWVLKRKFWNGVLPARCLWKSALVINTFILLHWSVIAYWPSGKGYDLRWGSSSTEAVSKELGKQGFFWKAVRMCIRVTTTVAYHQCLYWTALRSSFWAFWGHNCSC